MFRCVSKSSWLQSDRSSPFEMSEMQYVVQREKKEDPSLTDCRDRMINELDSMEKELNCPICLCVMEDPHSLPCNHNFCRNCLLHAFQNNSACPICKLPTFRREMRRNPVLNNVISVYQKLKGIVSTTIRDIPISTAISSVETDASNVSDNKTSGKCHINEGNEFFPREQTKTNNLDLNCLPITSERRMKRNFRSKRISSSQHNSIVDRHNKEVPKQNESAQSKKKDCVLLGENSISVVSKRKRNAMRELKELLKEKVISKCNEHEEFGKSITSEMESLMTFSNPFCSRTLRSTGRKNAISQNFDQSNLTETDTEISSFTADSSYQEIGKSSVSLDKTRNIHGDQRGSLRLRKQATFSSTNATVAVSSMRTEAGSSINATINMENSIIPGNKRKQLPISSELSFANSSPSFTPLSRRSSRSRIPNDPAQFSSCHNFVLLGTGLTIEEQMILVSFRIK